MRLVSLVGFLSQGLGEPPRMSRRQKEAVLAGARAALEAAYPARAATGLLEALQGALDQVPDSTSCHCCDFFAGPYCRYWADDVPQRVQSEGCPKFQDHGAPF